MKTSEALKNLHFELFGPPNADQLTLIKNQIFSMVAQAPGLDLGELTKLTFATPAEIRQLHQTNPQQAQKNLLSAIGAAMAWESVGQHKASGPTKKDWQNFINQGK